MNIWQGNRVRLRAIEPKDAEVFYRWNQDSDMGRNLDFAWPPASLESQRQWAQELSRQRPKNDELFLAIENRAGELVGSIDTHHCDRRSGTFKYGIAVRAEHQRQGYASEAILLVLRYFFLELGYQKVTVDVHGDNEASSQLHERLGFLLEGRIRRMVYTHGQYFDELVYGLTAVEFRERYPELIEGV